MSDEWADRVKCEGTGARISPQMMIAQRPDQRVACHHCGETIQCDFHNGWMIRRHYRRLSLADSPWIDNDA